MKVAGSGVPPLPARSRTGRLELRWLRHWADRILILNEGMREEAAISGLSPGRLGWMPNPVDTDEFAPCGEEERRRLRARWNLPQESRPQPGKGP